MKRSKRLVKHERRYKEEKVKSEIYLKDFVYKGDSIIGTTIKCDVFTIDYSFTTLIRQVPERY